MSGIDRSVHELATAIRKHCLECSGGSMKMVDGCRIKGCALYPYRSNKASGGKVQKPLNGQISVFEMKGVKDDEVS